MLTIACSLRVGTVKVSACLSDLNRTLWSIFIHCSESSSVSLPCVLSSNCLRVVNPNPTENRKSIMSASDQHEIFQPHSFQITEKYQSFITNQVRAIYTDLIHDNRTKWEDRQTVASNPGSPFRILSRSFEEKSEGEPGRISHVIRWHRDVNLPGTDTTTSLEKRNESGNKDCLHPVCLRGIRICRFGENRRPYD